MKKYLELTISVQGMMCERCKERVYKALKRTKGVKDIEIDLDAKTVKVKYLEDKTKREEIIKTIIDLGYEAKS